MNISTVYQLIGTALLVGGAAWALLKALWTRFEARMDQGDSKIMSKLNAMDTDHLADRGDIKALQLENIDIRLAQAEMKGAINTLTAIFAANASTIIKPQSHEGVNPS